MMISHKGYGISRSELNDDKLKEIKEELTVKPFNIEDYGGPPNPFPVYKISNLRIYIPKFYGIDKFGPSHKNEERLGNDILIKFQGNLRQDQIEFVDKISNHIIEKDSCIACATTGVGKCLGFNTPVMMHDGTIKMVQDIKEGEFLMGDNSTPRKVLSLARGIDDLYEIKPIKGTSYIVNKEHILSLVHTITGKKIDISIVDYLKSSKNFRHCYKGYRVPIEFKEQPHELPLDPYLLGLWLGDGVSSGVGISSQDATVLHYIANKLPEYKCYLQYVIYNHKKRNCYDYRINGDHCKDKDKNNINYFIVALRKLNLINNKHIPDIYKYNSRENRLKLLAGLLDTDGHLHNGGYDFIQKNKKLAYDVEYLARSLGFFSYNKQCQKSCMYKGEKRTGIYYRMEINGKGIEEIPCLIPRKKAKKRLQKKDVLRYGFQVIPKGQGDYYGFEIDGNRRFVLGDFTVTHNTTMSLNILSKFQKKTLIIVHKEFLLNQWKERIEQFLVNNDGTPVRVGTIRQTKIEVEDKDIVIGMLQSISMKEYSKETFDSFGFVIIDETHHICSKTFSKALFKISTKKMLGLSATPTRKDGLTKVLNWFLGPILYKEVNVNEEISTPMVKIIPARYENNGDNIVVKYLRSFQGKPPKINIADLITQISKDPVRNKQIADEIVLQVTTGRKVIVLMDRRQQCFEIKELLDNSSFTVGLYIGSMKNEELESANKCDVILATYQIASEGYDNPKLDTLIFASSKSDIEQSCGRILRRKNANTPLFIDIADMKFRYNQVKSRKSYFKKKGYIILNREEKKEVLEKIEFLD